MEPAVWTALCLLVSLAAVKAGPARERQEPQPASAFNRFANKLYLAISRLNQEKNVVFSPYSIGSAIRMVQKGASGETLEEINNLIAGNSSDADDANLDTGLDIKMPPQSKVQFTSANGLYHQEEVTMKPSYLAAIASQPYKPVVEKCNFRGDPQGCRRHINDWVARNTAQKIPELLKDDFISPSTVAVLANAVYFKAPWDKTFPSDSIRSFPFYRLGRENDQQNVPYLEDTRSCRYSENDKTTTVGIPYADDVAYFCVVLPKKRDGLAEVEGDVVKQCLDVVDANGEEVALKIPKFKTQHNVDLKGVLTSLGLKSMFSHGANFEKMTDSKVMVSDAVHEAFIDVNENGTEAAAATGFGFQYLSMPPPPVPFVADHPFFYAIVFKQSRVVLFAGKVLSIE